MALFEFDDKAPKIHPEAFIAPTAVLIGDVTVEGVRRCGSTRCCGPITRVHVGAEALIANHCTVLDGAVIGSRSLIAAHSLVVGGTKIPEEVLVTGAPAKIKGPIAGTSAEMWVNVNPGEYQSLARRYREGLKPVAE